jgi:hypothetical protein
LAYPIDAAVAESGTVLTYFFYQNLPNTFYRQLIRRQSTDIRRQTIMPVLWRCKKLPVKGIWQILVKEIGVIDEGIENFLFF